MADENDYRTLQQPAGGGYGSLQTPAPVLATAQQTPGAGGGGAGSGTAPPAGKTYILPDAETLWSTHTSRIPAISKLPLFEKSPPNYDQIHQQQLANCYLAATLASMAHTKEGVEVIKKMIAPHAGAITTICKKYDSDNNVSPPMQLKSDRWFTVSFKNESRDVSDVLYHDDSDRNPNLRYLTTPNNDQALWGAIIEVAYAALKGGYDLISANTGPSLDVFQQEFCPLEWELLYPGKDDAMIKKACINAGKKSALVASNIDAKKLPHGWHGYAVLGMSGTTVKLYDPLDAKEVSIEFADLLTDIQAASKVK